MDKSESFIAAALTSRYVVLEQAATLPARPETDNNGLKMEMVYPEGDF